MVLLGFSAEIGFDISHILVTAAMTLTLDQAIKRGLTVKVHALFFVIFYKVYRVGGVA
jgi:hypothetical protein